MLRKLTGLVVILVAVLLLAALVLYRLGEEQRQVVSLERLHATSGIPVEVVRPVRMDFADYLLCDGSVTADVRAFLRAKVDETVEAVHARVGEPVKKGQVLVEFRTTDLEAAIQAAEAAFGEATSNLERCRKLYAQNVISEDRVEQARTLKESADARLRSARSRLKFARLESPIDGVVEHRWVEPGEYKGVGKELMSVVDLSTVEVAALVPEQDVPNLSMGTEGEFQLEGNSEWLKGQVSRISPSTTDPNRFFDVYLKVENERTNGGWLMRSGMYAEVRFLGRIITDVLAVPDNTIVREGEARAIYVVETFTEKVPVRAAAAQDRGSGQNKLIARLKRGLARLRRAEPQPQGQQDVPMEEREFQRARRIVVSSGLGERGLVQILGAELTGKELVIVNPRDDIRDGTLVKIVEGGD